VDAESKAEGIPVKADRSHGCSGAFLGTNTETLSELPFWRNDEFEDEGRCADSARFSAS
jgi:hypothetical protein